METISLWDRARALGDTVRNAFAPVPADDAAFGSFGLDNNLTDEMRSTIAARIDEGRQNAQERGEDFSIEHYRQACVAFGENNPDGQRMVAEGKWSPASYADLSGQNLQGIRLTNPQAIKPAHELSPAIQADYDSFDRDGDGKINSPAVNQFYDRVMFDKNTDLRNAIVDPATSFNKEIAGAGNIDGLTFNNMSADDPAFVFGAGNYTNIKMTNIQGGEIVFGSGSHVDGLTIDGVSARVTIGDRARVSDVTPTNGFSMVLLSMGEGSLLSNADLTNATISQASEFGQGATLQSVTFGSNVSGVDFEGVTLNKAVFNGSNLSDASFAGATLNGVTFNDIDLATLDLSGVQRMNGVTVNGKQVATARDLEMMQLAGGVSIPTWNPALNTPAPSAPAQTAKVIDPLAEANPNDTLANLARAQDIVNVNAANNPNDLLAAIRASSAASAITFGGEANFNTVTQTAAVTSQPRTVPIEEQATGANMQRSTSGNA